MLICQNISPVMFELKLALVAGGDVTFTAGSVWLVISGGDVALTSGCYKVYTIFTVVIIGGVCFITESGII